ncbi:hypothetical protein PG990_013077 [Apiospora arundinis]
MGDSQFCEICLAEFPPRATVESISIIPASFPNRPTLIHEKKHLDVFQRHAVIPGTDCKSIIVAILHASCFHAITRLCGTSTDKLFKLIEVFASLKPLQIGMNSLLEAYSLQSVDILATWATRWERLRLLNQPEESHLLYTSNAPPIQHSRLLQLPLELNLAIFGRLSFRDATSLRLSCKGLWNLGTVSGFWKDQFEDEYPLASFFVAPHPDFKYSSWKSLYRLAKIHYTHYEPAILWRERLRPMVDAIDHLNGSELSGNMISAWWNLDRREDVDYLCSERLAAFQAGNILYIREIEVKGAVQETFASLVILKGELFATGLRLVLAKEELLLGYCYRSRERCLKSGRTLTGLSFNPVQGNSWYSLILMTPSPGGSERAWTGSD